MGIKYRVIQSDNTMWYPQMKTIWFGTWYGFKPDADRTSRPDCFRLVRERDFPASAAFHTEAEAVAFVDRYKGNYERYWEEVPKRWMRELHQPKPKYIRPL